MFLGADTLSNNTGELTAIGEAILWTLYQATHPNEPHHHICCKPILFITQR